MAGSTWSHAQSECQNKEPNLCSAQGVQDGGSASGQATTSTVAFVAGAALLERAQAVLHRANGQNRNYQLHRRGEWGFQRGGAW